MPPTPVRNRVIWNLSLDEAHASLSGDAKWGLHVRSDGTKVELQTLLNEGSKQRDERGIKVK